MSTKEQFEIKLENSFKKLKTSVSGLQLTKWEIENRIKKVLEKELKDIQIITQLKYLEGLSISEISIVTNKSKYEVYAYLDYIISRINSVIIIEEKEFSIKIDNQNTDLPNSTNEHILDIKG